MSESNFITDEGGRREVQVKGVKAVLVVQEYAGPAPEGPMSHKIDDEELAVNVLTGAPALASVATLCNSAIGAGVLSLPFAFRKSGALGGVLLCATIGAAEAFTLYVLTKMAERYGAMSYSQLVRATMGKKMATFLAILMVVYMWGACNAYIVIMADVFGSLAREYFGPDSLAANRYIMIGALGATILLPLCFVKRLAALAALSSVAVLGFLYTTAVVMKEAFQVMEARTDPWEGVDLLHLDYRALYALPIVVFGFNCHANAVPIFHELAEEPSEQLLPFRSRRKTSKLVNMISVILASIMLIMSGYLAVGLAGYIAYPDSVSGNILNSLPEGDPWVQAARLLIGIVVVGHYPLNHHPARAGALDLAALAGFSDTTIQNVVSPVFTTIFTLTSVIVSMFCKDLGDVIHIIGGTAAACLIFFNPGCMLINAAIIKHSTSTLSSIQKKAESDMSLRDKDIAADGAAASDALRVPLLQAAARKGIKTGLVYSPGRSWVAGLALVCFSIFILVVTLVTSFIN